MLLPGLSPRQGFKIQTQAKCDASQYGNLFYMDIMVSIKLAWQRISLRNHL